MFLFIYCKIVSSRIGFYQNDIHRSQNVNKYATVYITIVDLVLVL